MDLVAQARGFLEPQIAGRVVHLVGEALDQPPELVTRKIEAISLGRRARPAPTAAAPSGATAARFVVVGAHADHLEDVGDLLAHRLRIDAVFEVVCDLLLAAAHRLEIAYVIESVMRSAYMIT